MCQPLWHETMCFVVETGHKLTNVKQVQWDLGNCRISISGFHYLWMFSLCLRRPLGQQKTTSDQVMFGGMRRPMQNTGLLMPSYGLIMSSPHAMPQNIFQMWPESILMHWKWVLVMSGRRSEEAVKPMEWAMSMAWFPDGPPSYLLMATYLDTSCEPGNLTEAWYVLVQYRKPCCKCGNKLHHRNTVSSQPPSCICWNSVSSIFVKVLGALKWSHLPTSI